MSKATDTHAVKFAPPDAKLRPRTLMVRGATWRSPHGETSEAIFMNSGYVYGSAEEAEAAFVNAGSRFVYSRYASPTVNMFEARLRLIEGAEACRSTATLPVSRSTVTTATLQP